VARALARHAPTIILRPALGATKALSNALLGVGNALDEGSRRKIEDVSTGDGTMMEVWKLTNCRNTSRISRVDSTTQHISAALYQHGTNQGGLSYGVMFL
jgi:hypothetical protein